MQPAWYAHSFLDSALKVEKEEQERGDPLHLPLVSFDPAVAVVPSSAHDVPVVPDEQAHTREAEATNAARRR